MDIDQTARRNLLLSLVTLPITALVLPRALAATEVKRIVVFGGVLRGAQGWDHHAFGWGAETAQGWTGRVVDGWERAAVRDFPGFAAGVTAVAPKGMAHTINGDTDKDGVRGASVCFENVTEGSVVGSTVKLRGSIIAAENPTVFRLGDPMTMEGNADTGEFVYTLRGGGKDNVFNHKGVLLVR